MTFNDTNFEEAAAVFRPIFDEIAADAAGREHERRLAFEAVARLKDAGFGRVRIPREHGGFGLSLEQFFELFIELGEADSNLPQLLRGHFAFLEGRRTAKDATVESRWYPRVVEGVLFGNAQAERGAATENSTALERVGDGWVLNGVKYYSTGSIYADWLWTTAKHGDDHVGVALPATTPGVTRVDDWDGFGQRLTGSGTTRFEDVAIEDSWIVRFDPDREDHPFITAFYQLVLLAALAGIARAVVRDAVAFVQPRTRTFGVPGQSSPREDPLVQSVVGKLASVSHVVDASVLSVARELDAAQHAYLNSEVDATSERQEGGPFIAVQFSAYKAQQLVVPLVIDAASELFEVGGASATSEARRLDRHWRNARTIGSHNPLISRKRTIGDYLLNGRIPESRFTQKSADATVGAPPEPALASA